MIQQFDDLNQTCFRVNTTRDHTMMFELIEIVVIKLVAVTMTFTNVKTAVNLMRQ